MSNFTGAFWIIKMYFVFLLFIFRVESLRIKEIRGPDTVQTGNLSKLVLDCDFELTEEEERDKESELVIKWFISTKQYPIYQWIPNVPPLAFGILSGRVDLNHVASDHESFRHRALAIRNPTPELTGEYTCRVSTFTNEVSRKKSVIIYSSAAQVSLTYKFKSHQSVALSCTVSNIYPKPTMSLFSETDGMRKKEASVVQTTITEDRKSYVGLLEYELEYEELDLATLYKCLVEIPGTQYSVEDELYYLPGDPAFAQTALSTSPIFQSSFTLQMIFLILYFTLARQ